MRIDSCKKCGQQLKISRECSVCDEPIEFHCTECRIVNEEQIHQNCMLVAFNYNLLKAITV